MLKLPVHVLPGAESPAIPIQSPRLSAPRSMYTFAGVHNVVFSECVWKLTGYSSVMKKSVFILTLILEAGFYMVKRKALSGPRLARRRYESRV